MPLTAPGSLTRGSDVRRDRVSARARRASFADGATLDAKSLAAIQMPAKKSFRRRRSTRIGRRQERALSTGPSRLCNSVTTAIFGRVGPNAGPEQIRRRISAEQQDVRAKHGRRPACGGAYRQEAAANHASSSSSRRSFWWVELESCGVCTIARRRTAPTVRCRRPSRARATGCFSVSRASRRCALTRSRRTDRARSIRRACRSSSTRRARSSSPSQALLRLGRRSRLRRRRPRADVHVDRQLDVRD